MKVSPLLIGVCSLLSLLMIPTSVGAEAVTAMDLFPVSGVTLGKTTLEQLPATGKGLEQEIEASGTLWLDSVEFSYVEGLLVSLELTKDRPMPVLWEKAGFDWSLPYQSWLGLLEKMGFTINPLQAPTLQMKGNHPVMEARFEAFRSSRFPTVFTFTFIENQGSGLDSEDTLYKISACYIPGFKGFNFENQYREPVTLDDSKRKVLALSGIAAEIDGLNHEKLELSAVNRTSIEYWKQVLKEKWGITDRNQLLEKLAFIESKGDSQVYWDLVNLLEKNQNLTINQMGTQLDYGPGTINQLYFVKEKRDLIGDQALRAWDYSKIALLCRIGYQVGFFSADETWRRLERILVKVENTYQSWEDYAANYLLGMIFQAAETGLEMDTGNRGLRAYAKLSNSQGTAWQLAWGGNASTYRVGGNTLSDVLYFPSAQYRAWTAYLKGWESYEKRDLTEALNYFNNSLSLDPKFEAPWLTVAMVYNMQNDLEKAIRAFKEYLNKNPDEYLPRIYLAEVYEKNNQLLKATEEYNKAIDLDDSRPEGFIGLGRVAINSGDYQLAVSYLRVAESLTVNTDQGIFYNLYLLGYSYYKAENFDKALSYFLRAYNNYQDNSYLNYYLGVCYLYNQNIKLASDYLGRAEALGLAIPPEIKSLLEQPDKL